MKQQLWIVNSSLLIIFILIILINMFLKQELPSVRITHAYAEERKKTKDFSPEEAESIYKYDLFETSEKKEFIPSFKKLVTPIPKPKLAPPPQPPKILLPSFIPPLKMILKGIVYATDEEKSICIFEDETKKERAFHVGDMVKDAQIIKIGHNKISLLRANGQHETIFLRKEDKKIIVKPEKKDWSHVVRKLNASSFEIDTIQFAKEIPSLGAIIEMLSLLTTYEQGVPTGVKIANFTTDSIGPFLGLEKNDIITSINGISTTNRNTRIKIYDMITSAKKGTTITLELLRNDQKITLSYLLSHIISTPKREFAIKGKALTEAEEKKLFKLNQLQEREKQRRDFAKKHQAEQPPQQRVVEEIRKRLLENLQQRVRNTRIR